MPQYLVKAELTFIGSVVVEAQSEAGALAIANAAANEDLAPGTPVLEYDFDDRLAYASITPFEAELLTRRQPEARQG